MIKNKLFKKNLFFVYILYTMLVLFTNIYALKCYSLTNWLQPLTKKSEIKKQENFDYNLYYKQNFNGFKLIPLKNKEDIMFDKVYWFDKYNKEVLGRALV